MTYKILVIIGDILWIIQTIEKLEIFHGGY